MAQFDGNLDETGTGGQLVVLGRPAPRPQRRDAPEAAFLSQLIAERYRLAPQREKRRAPVGDAVGAYATGSRVAEVRMPIGYRTTVLA